MDFEIPQRPQLEPGGLLLRVLLAVLLLALVLLGIDDGVRVDETDLTITRVQGPEALPSAAVTAVKAEVSGVPHSPALDLGEIDDAILGAVSERFVGDLDAMRKRGFIRVLVSYNRSNFFLTGADDGELGVEARGFEHDLMEQYRGFVNDKSKRRQPALQLVYVPVPFDKLIDALREGRGDIIAAGMTVTPQRSEQVAFTRPYLSGVDEVIVANAGMVGLERMDDLAGRRLPVLRGSSYARHLQQLSDSMQARGLAAIEIEQVADHVQTEDLLELVNSGALELTVADEHVALLWASVLPNIRVHQALAINQGGELAWAVRPGNTQLLASLNRFVGSHRKGTRLGNILFKRFYKDSRWVSDPTSKAQRAKLAKLAKLFRQYAEQYGFDWLLIAAQAFQESGLNHSARSHAGAVGIMQVKPSTAADRNVGIRGIKDLERNIHAGVKYLAFLRDRYFTDPAIAADDQLYFSLAAYNAGPAAVRRMRARAAKMGLNRNQWFGQVELAALRSHGREPVRYVGNILKYSTAYKLSYEARQQRDRERRALVREALGAG